jgi:hypothetical protein
VTAVYQFNQNDKVVKAKRALAQQSGDWKRVSMRHLPYLILEQRMVNHRNSRRTLQLEQPHSTPSTDGMASPEREETPARTTSLVRRREDGDADADSAAAEQNMPPRQRQKARRFRVPNDEFAGIIRQQFRYTSENLLDASLVCDGPEVWKWWAENYTKVAAEHGVTRLATARQFRQTLLYFVSKGNAAQFFTQPQLEALKRRLEEPKMWAFNPQENIGGNGHSV